MKLDIGSMKESLDFLNFLYDHVTSAIFIADENAVIHSFNNAFQTLFFKKEDEILQHLCGNVIGCIYQVQEGKDCGTTSNCDRCELRKCVIFSFTEKVPVYHEKLERDFLVNGEFIRKYFIFSTRYIRYQDQDLVLVIVDDMTEIEENRRKLEHVNHILRQENRFLNELVDEQMLKIVANTQNLAQEREKKSELIHEVHHRVGNNLQMISSLLNIQCSLTGDGKTRELLSEVQLRIRVLKTIFNEVYRDDFESMINLNRMVPLICADAVPSSVIMNYEVADQLWTIEQALILGLLISEVVKIIWLSGGDPVENESASLILASQNGRWLLKMTGSHTGLRNGSSMEDHPSSVLFIRMLERQLDAEGVFSPEDGCYYHLIF
jgi:two-component sensor histidine kinase